jgi:fructose/tagatose bisphosphate aldolase
MTDQRMLQEITAAHAHRRAIAAVSIDDAVGAQALVRAARDERLLVIIATGSSSIAFTGQMPLAEVALAVRDQSPSRNDLTPHFAAVPEADAEVIRTKIRVFDRSDPEPKETLA